MKQQVKRLSWLPIGAAFIIALVAGRAAIEVRPVFAQTANVTVTINAPDTAAPGSDFTATIEVSQMRDFDACNYNVSFDSTVLRLDNIAAGQIGSTAIPVSAWNQTGPGSYTILQNVPGLSGASGSGRLAVLHFRVIGSPGQVSQINLFDGTLVNIEAQSIPATWTGISLQVAATSVENPSRQDATIAKESGNPALTTQPKPPAKSQTNWLTLWGIIGAVVVVVILLIILQAGRSRN